MGLNFVNDGKNANLSKTLLAVRKSFRIVASYQQRTLQLIDYMCRLFPELEYDFWTPEHWDSTGRNILPSQGKWEIDGLPFYSFSVLMIEPKLRFAIEILHSADSGLDDIEDFQSFNPTELADPEETSTTLSLIGWRMEGIETRAEWRSAYYECEWPHEDDQLEPTGLNEISNFRHQIDIGKLENRDAIDSFVNHFRSRLIANGFPIDEALR